MNNQTSYEFPLNERIRVFMRLEQLFIELKHFLMGDSVLDKRAVMGTLLSISMIFSRNNIKSELLKETERLLNVLKKMGDNSEIDADKLDDILTKLNASKSLLHTYNEKIGASLAKNYLFQSFSQRGAIPGGTCSFDLPAYHYWLAQDEEKQSREVKEWTKPFLDMYQGIELILNLIRDSGEPQDELAKKGFFQLTLRNHEICQLLRVQIPQTSPCFAEISGGRHRFTVRFMKAALEGKRPAQSIVDMPFSLSCCYR
ncbi:MAG: cell division protein ZapD [Methylococcales bacterium]|nr:cell division protein ZapD [Methylococcales bacterium]